MSALHVDPGHPLSEAMNAVGLERDPACEVRALRTKSSPDYKSAIYRVGVRGMEVATVVAKRSMSDAAAVERTMYESVLPALPVASPAYYGCFTEDDREYTWLFLEYINGEKVSWDEHAHRSAAAHWLASLHTSATRVMGTVGLPDRGPDHYYQRLESSQTRLRRIVEDSTVPACTGPAVRMLDQLEAVRNAWPMIQELAGTLPRTVVHGDFKRSNMRVIQRSRKLELYAFDWEFAGTGVPAVDLWWIGIAEYIRSIRGAHHVPNAAEMQGIRNLGLLFRTLASIDWCLEHTIWRDGDKPIELLKFYSVDLAHLIG